IALIAGILLSRYNLWFTVITLVSVVVYIMFTLLITEWRMHYRVAMNAADSRANSQAIDSLLNYETVKYFGNEGYELTRYDNSLRDWENSAVSSQTSLSALNFGQAGIIAIGVTLIMILAAQGVIAGTMTLGDLVLVNAFLLQLFIPLNFLGIVYSQLKHSLTDMQLMFDVLHREPEINDRPGAPDLDPGTAEVRFERVAFSYDAERPILHDISFTIAPGHKVAIVGPSGAGKSTLARLLFRFYDTTTGRILINGQDISQVTQDSLRRAIGIVPQDTVLFNDSLHYNIAYARPDATRADIERAAQLANIHEFIKALPQGYDTVVGERGLKLSGGEKQRVAIARAILKNPRILVFDEATSSLDSHSEQAILEALREAAAHHTTLVIAHRLSTVVDADHILVLDSGRIVERGTHRQLLSHDGIYARLWALQQEEARHELVADPAGLIVDT
ncbi:MAG: ABC transporter ATP-binding protein/permease, partial [Gammaproteobacteria bacterium]